ncbi:hypothetical protein BGY98DRAFT_1188559 [Russula aff. rugulosa BPL654]|nr:hypothetical protein BGY98DRAFT_1188559 [Russula aff. rugulosa BPL654]
MSVDLEAPRLKAIRIVVVSAAVLAKPNVSSLPDPFAVIIVDSEQTRTTSVIKKTLNPYWNEYFDFMVKGSSVVTVQVFDQRKFKRRNQGLLGFVEIRVTDYLDLELGGQETVQLDLKGTNDNLVVQGKLISHLSTIPTTSITSSRPNGSSLALTTLASNDPSHSVNYASVDNYLVNNYSVDNASVDNYSVDNASVNNYSVDNASVDNYSVDNASVDNYSVNNASVYAASVSELYGPSIRLSRTPGSHTTSSEVATPIMAMPTTTIPGTRLEQQQSLPNTPTHPVSSGGTSIADHPQNSPRPCAPRIVSPGQPITNAQHNLNSNEDQYGPLPEGWETGIDLLGLTYYVNHRTHRITRNRPDSNEAVDRQGETTLARVVRLPDERNGTRRMTTDREPERSGYFLQPQTISQLGPFPSGTTTWDDPRLPSSLDADSPQYKRDFHEKLIYFRTQPGMRAQPGYCLIRVRGASIFEDSYEEIMRQTPSNLKKQLMFEFEGNGESDFGGPSREFFFLFSHEIFYCLFEYSARDNYMLQINPASGVNPGVSIISSSSAAFWA